MAIQESRAGGLLASAVILACATLLTACTANVLLPGDIRMTAADLTLRLQKHFPVERSVAGLVDVKFDKPAMSLDAAQNRLVATVDMTVSFALSNKRLGGLIAISGVPYYDPPTRGLFFRNARVDRLRIDNMPEALAGAVAKLASQLARSNFEDKPCLTFKPEDFSRFGARVEPAAIQIKDDALVLMLQK